MTIEKLKAKALDIEKYNFAYINCFVRAVSMEVERLLPGSSNYFISIYSFSRSFSNIKLNYDYRISKINGYNYNPDHKHELNLLDKILNDYFGLKLKSFPTNEKTSIIELITENVDNGKSTLVPVNPSVLPFCDYYKEKKWIHWLYCNGYDKIKELILVEDHVQFGMESTIYRPFRYTEEEIKKLHDSYNEVWSDVPSLNKCYSLDQFNNPRIFNDITFFKELEVLLEYYIKHHKEIFHIEEIALVEEDYDLIFSLKHLKTIYNNTFCDLLYRNFEEEEKIRDLQTLAINIKNKWDTLARNTKLAQLRKKVIDQNEINMETSLIKELEYDYFVSLLKISKEMGRNDLK
ncbi:hypothetical protein [Alkalihalophilus marmarensis]|uniref:hypothetical protein n=1 Tax=Alkalihalophilus marmarensis TaxID=521377 RepID=UPI002DBF5AFE|nr:hypothetical protein [Alkalihalophilus marmarensis]MEC2074261.1 hypothetical protein [Alkalihalophilus marmarensis]